MYNMTYAPKALKFFKKLDISLRNTIMEKLKHLQENPFSPELDIKKLNGHEGYRMRVGDYRVLYTIERDIVTIYIVSIAHRREIYR